MNDTNPTGARRIEPWIPVHHPDFKWTPHGNAQAIWRKYGWTPPSESRTPAVVEPVTETEQVRVLKRKGARA